MKTITLTDEQYNELLLALRELEVYRWNDNHISAADKSPDKLRAVIEASAATKAKQPGPAEWCIFR